VTAAVGVLAATGKVGVEAPDAAEAATVAERVLRRVAMEC
jgi:hypothetical protein